MRSTIVEVINCKEFKKLANHPVQFYLNHSLGIYVREEPIIRKREGEFILSPIDRAQVRATFGSDCAKVAFPMGVYGEVGRSVVADEMGVINSALQTFGVNREEIYRVDLGKTTKSVRVSFGRKEIEIVGSIPFALCPQGILFYGSDHVKELVRVWPFYLIARLSEDVEPYVLCMKSEKKVSFVVPSVEEALREYIEYYHMCLHSPSPMMPMWSPSLLKGSVDDLEKVMKAKRPFVDSYLDWFLERKGFADLDLVHDMWSLNVKEVFKPMVKE